MKWLGLGLSFKLINPYRILLSMNKILHNKWNNLDEL